MLHCHLLYGKSLKLFLVRPNSIAEDGSQKNIYIFTCSNIFKRSKGATAVRDLQYSDFSMAEIQTKSQKIQFFFSEMNLKDN